MELLDSVYFCNPFTSTDLKWYVPDHGKDYTILGT